MNNSDLDKKIEELLYYKNGLLSIKEYLEIIDDNRVVWIKYNIDNFVIRTNTGKEFKINVYK